MPFVCLVTPSPNRRHTERAWSHFRSRWHLLATEPEGLSPSSVYAHRCYDCRYLVIVMAVCTNWLQVDHKKGSADFWDEFAGALAWHSMHSIRMVSRWHVWMGHSGPMMARIGIYADQSQLLCSCAFFWNPLNIFEFTCRVCPTRAGLWLPFSLAPNFTSAHPQPDRTSRPGSCTLWRLAVTEGAEFAPWERKFTKTAVFNAIRRSETFLLFFIHVSSLSSFHIPVCTFRPSFWRAACHACPSVIVTSESSEELLPQAQWSCGVFRAKRRRLFL